MRIDTMTYLNTSLPGIQSNQSAIARLSQQIGTGLSMLATKDDPIVAEKALDLSTRISVRTQFAANQDKAELDLNYENVVTKEMASSMNQARGLLVQISPSHSASLLNVHAEQLKGVFNHLLDLANTQDPAGNYIFAGHKTTTQPFVNNRTAIVPATVPPTVQATTYSGTLQTPAIPVPGFVPPAPPAPTAPGGSRWTEINIGQYVQVNDNLDQVFQAGMAGDLLQQLGGAIDNLTSGTITQADIDGYVAVINSAASKLELIQHRIAGTLTEIKDVRASTQAMLLLEKNALSDLTQVDKAAAIVELQSRQTTLEAISRAYALTSGLSLFNYLS